MPNKIKTYGFTYSIAALAAGANTFSNWTIQKLQGTQLKLKNVFVGLNLNDDVTASNIMTNHTYNFLSAAISNINVQVSLSDQNAAPNTFLRPQVVALGAVSAQISPDIIFCRVGVKNTFENLISSVGWTLNVGITNHCPNPISGQIFWIAEVEEIE